MLSRSQINEWVLSLTVLLLFLLVAHQGYVGVSMENDGLIYASIAKHLALGEGSFWFPYSPLSEAAFHHHPPLSFWLQSLHFRLFGDHFWVENLYQFTCLCVVLVCLQFSWQLSTNQKTGGWRTWLLFLCAPVVSFVFTDNFLEAPLTMFVCLAVVFLQLSFKRDSYLFVALASSMTLAAFLVKGPVGLLPLGVVPVLGWLYNNKRWVGFTIGHALMFVIFLGLLMLHQDAQQSMKNYIEFQWLGTARGELAQIHGRDYLLLELARNLLTLILIGAFLAWKLKLKWNRATGTWLAIALMASLPLLISPRQFKWYLAPSMPFYALAVASYLGPTSELSTKVRRIIYTAPLLMALSLAYLGVTRFATLDNDFAAVHDLRLVQKAVPEGQTIGYCGGDELSRYFLYLSRYHSVKIQNLAGQEFVFCNQVLAGYELSLEELQLVPLLRRL